MKEKKEKKTDKIIASALLIFILILVTLVYSNHFNNPFQFDDSHTIENNIYIKSLKNIPLFFKDASTTSSLPSNQTYRPMVSVTLALDYALGKGLNPFYFHLSMFFWYLLQLVLMFFMFIKILNTFSPHKWNKYIVLFTVAWYGFHTVNAETLNYVISRSDSLSTFCVVASMFLYITLPKMRKWLLYLIPAIIGMFVKEQAAMFAPILFVYIYIFENKMSLFDIFKKAHLNKLGNSIWRSIPAFIVCGALGILVIKMQPESFTPGGVSPFHYFITQPWVYLRYFISFFLPLNLSADTDWKAFQNIFDERVIVGFGFIILLIYVAFKTSKEQQLKPISFGILWYLLALLPTSSIIPLSEVTNDHRMFFPFVGLAFGVVSALRLVIIKNEKRLISKNHLKIIVIILSLSILGANAYGVRQRNKIWHSAESLWYDVSIKSPTNGRGLMNYGLSQMRIGNYEVALDYFNKAFVYLPYYAYLQINLGVVKNAMGNKTEAEAHYRKGIELGSTYNETYYFYAEFLFNQGRISEALVNAEQSLKLSHAHLPTRHLLLNIYLKNNQGDKLNKLVQETLQIYPDDSFTKSFQNFKPGQTYNEIEAAEIRAKENKTPENYLNLSLIYYNNQLYEKCIDACNEAIALRPDYPEAYNNICSAYNSLGQWDKAIEACKKGLELKPDYTLCRNNLNYAYSQINKK